MKVICANYLLPVSSPPIENGAIAIDGGKIAAAGSRAEIMENFPNALIDDLGEAALLPGFVNTHSHLELTLLRGMLDSKEDDFFSWLLTLTKAREKFSGDNLRLSALAGALEGAKAGITCFGDIGRFGFAGHYALRETGLRGISFQETEFSPSNSLAREHFIALKEKYLALRENDCELVSSGISPHSPYTVSEKLFELIADYSIAGNIPVSIHAAESLMEENLLKEGTGGFADLFKDMGIDWKSPKLSPVSYLQSTGILKTAPLLAHCVYANAEDMAILKETSSKIAHCPKSNSKLGHGIAPLADFIDFGLTVGFGSDSVSSNNTCDMIEEARFGSLLARSKGNGSRFLPAERIIRLMTLGGAQALGLEDRIGTIEEGKDADIVAVSLDDIAQQPILDVNSAILYASSGKNVVMTMAAGKELFRNGVSLVVDEKRLNANIKAILPGLSAP